MGRGATYQEFESSRLAPTAYPRLPRPEPPAQAVPGLEHFPPQIELASQRVESTFGEKSFVANGLRQDAVPCLEGFVALSHHRRTARGVSVERRVHDDDMTLWGEHPQRLRQGRPEVGRVMEGGVIHEKIGAPFGERQAIEFGLHGQKAVSVVPMDAETVVVIGHEIDRCDLVPPARKSMSEPSDAASEIENPETWSHSLHGLENPQDERAVALRANEPLVGSLSRSVSKREGQ